MECNYPQIPQLILHNAAVHTLDSKYSVAQAVAVSGNRILATGSDDCVPFSLSLSL